MFNTLGNRKENTENFILIGVWQSVHGMGYSH